MSKKDDYLALGFGGIAGCMKDTYGQLALEVKVLGNHVTAIQASNPMQQSASDLVMIERDLENIKLQFDDIKLIRTCAGQILATEKATDDFDSTK